MARKRKDNISEVTFSYIGTDEQFDEFLKMLVHDYLSVDQPYTCLLYTSGFCCAGVRNDQHCSAGVAGGRCGEIAIVHFVNYKKGTQTRGCMKSVMRYVSQLSKTLWDGQQLVSGIDCQPETAFDEFLSTKLLHHKDGGVMFYHMVQSFPKGAAIDSRTAHEAAR